MTFRKMTLYFTFLPSKLINAVEYDFQNSKKCCTTRTLHRCINYRIYEALDASAVRKLLF